LYPVRERDVQDEPEEEAVEETGNLSNEAPQITSFLARGRFVRVSARTGSDVAGYVCDRDETGLLLDTRDPSGDAAGYELLPWSSIERVLEERTPR
jgi:hypothetical protein